MSRKFRWGEPQRPLYASPQRRSSVRRQRQKLKAKATQKDEQTARLDAQAARAAAYLPPSRGAGRQLVKRKDIKSN